VDGSYHDVDSSDMAFQIAGALAFKEAIRQASPILLEPIMDVSIVVPDEFIGHITGDISGRRGRVMGSEAKGKNQIIKAEIPLSEMFKYATDLRSMTGGRGNYTMRFAHYEQAPAKITEQVIASRKTTPSAA
jgi:elongation factor G